MKTKSQSFWFKKTIPVLIAVLLLTVSAVHLPDTTSAAEDEDIMGGIIKVAITNEPSQSIKPLNASSEGDLSILNLMYDSLAIRDVETGEMKPWLAESWTVGESEVTVTIRDDVLFWDETKLTPDDIVYSYKNYNGPLSVPVESYNQTSNTVTFELTSNNPAFFMSDGLKVPIVKKDTEAMGSGPFKDYNRIRKTGLEVSEEVVREARYESINSSKLNLVFDDVYDLSLYGEVMLPENQSERQDIIQEHPFLENHPGILNGTFLIEPGNYTLDKTVGHISGIRIPYLTKITADYKYNMTTSNLTTNEDYFKGRPYIDGLTFKVFETIGVPQTFNVDGISVGESGSAATNMAGAINRLGNGEIDIIKPVYPSIYKSYVNPAYSNLVRVPKNEMVYASYNADSSPFRVDENNVTRERAEEMKRATNMLFGRDTVVSNFLQGAGFKGATLVSPANEYWYNKNISAKSYDPAQANEIMSKNGYQDYDFDGMKELPNKDEFSLNVKMPGITIDENPSTIGNNLAGDSGLGSVFINSSSTPLTIKELNEAEKNGKFDITINRYNASLDPGKDIYKLFHSESPDNFIGLDDPKLDEEIEKANSILDTQERRRAIKDIQDTLTEKMPISVIYFPTEFHVYRQDEYTGWVSGFEVGPHNKQNYLSIHKIVDETLDVSVTMGKTISSGESTTLTASVKDQNDDPVENVSVNISATLGDLTPTNETTMTDQQGQVKFDYEPPQLAEGVSDVVLSIKATKGTNIGRTFFTSTVHAEEPFLQLNVDLGKTQMNSGDTTKVTVEIQGDFEEYPVVSLSLIPDTSSAWLEKTSNEGNTQNDTFETTLHTEDVKTETRFIVQATSSYRGVSASNDGSVTVSSAEEEGGAGNIILYSGLGALAVVIIIILLMMFMMKKPSFLEKEEEELPEEGEIEEEEVEEMEIEEEPELEEEEEEYFYEEPGEEEGAEELVEEEKEEEPSLEEEEMEDLEEE